VSVVERVLQPAKALRSVGWYRALVKRANGRCQICGRRGAEVGHGKLVLDHRHECCGPKNACQACVRGLLCRSCNAGLGMFGEDPARLRAAIAYLAIDRRSRQPIVQPLFEVAS
jgi:hypothetical protein